MGIAPEVTFSVKDGEDWITTTNQHGNTTSSKVAHVQRERPDEWALSAPAYDAWKADAKAQKEAKAADEVKTKAEAPEAEAAAPDDDDLGNPFVDADDDKNGKPGRRTLAKGYRK
jgi:hypothetical protein